MADDVVTSDSEAGQTPSQPPRSWRELWQIPALTIGAVLLSAGLAAAVLTKPAPDHAGMLDRAESLISSGEFEAAIEQLNRKVFPYESRGELDPASERQFHLLLGRALYQGQQALGISLAENNENIIKSFASAERAAATLTPRDTFFIADTLLSMGDAEAAIDRIESIRDEDRELWTRTYRRAIEQDLRPRGDRERAVRLLSSYRAAAELSPADRAWAVERQCRLLLEFGEADEAIAKLLREVQRLGQTDPVLMSRLFGLLAEAYLANGAIEAALDQVSRAEAAGVLDEALAARLALLRAQAEDRAGRIEAARDLYAAVIEEHQQSDELPEAMLGLAETHLDLEQTREGVEVYRELVGLITADRAMRELWIDRATDKLVSRARGLRERGELDRAIELARLAESMYSFEDRPATVLLELSRSHRAKADFLLGDVTELQAGSVATLDALPPTVREEARRHLIAAGAAASIHAERVVLTDDDAYSESVWNAAQAFALAGDLPEAIRQYQSFMDGFPDDPRRAEARFRLGQSFQGRGEYGLAADYYRGLIEDRNDDSVKGVGLWADLSYVPLAQSLLLDGDELNDDEAEGLLRAVVDGTVVSDPDALGRRDALLALGRLHIRTGANDQAIMRFEELLQRFSGGRDEAMVRYWLAEANRREADRLEEDLEQAMPESQRPRLEEARSDRLSRSLQLYDEVVTILGERDPRMRSTLEQRALRDAYFYRGASAFDLGDFDTAIRFYDTAYSRYPQDPASLVALVQIVNGYVASGDMARARVSNERAQRFFRSLPDEAWDDASLPMGRDEWERWLDSTTQLYASANERGRP